MGTRRRASGGADPRPPRPGGQEAATGPGYIHLVPRPRGPIGDVAGVGWVPPVCGLSLGSLVSAGGGLSACWDSYFLHLLALEFVRGEPPPPPLPSCRRGWGG